MEESLILSELLDLHGVAHLAELAGLSRVYLYKIKGGDRRATPEVYARIFNGFGSSFDLVRQLEVDAGPDEMKNRDRINNEIVLIVTLARGIMADGGS